jgi:iron(III) transport system permease protein
VLNYSRKWRGVLYALPIALLTLVPLTVVLASWAYPQPEVWLHLSDYVLPAVIKNTIILILGVGLGVLLIGVPLAWLAAMCEFPGRRFFSWSLILPLAMPAYVLAFVHVGFLDFTGPVQTMIRDISGDSFWFPPIRSTGGVIMVMSLAFYPYVYLLLRNAFETQGQRGLEAAQMLGLSRAQSFWRVSLPMARPWLIGGLGLVLMETLADFGAVSIFNFDTFTTAIYKSWFSLFNLMAASQVASILVMFVLMIAFLEQKARGVRRYQVKATQHKRIVLTPAKSALAIMFCSAVLLMGFVIPVAQLALWAWQAWAENVDIDIRYVSFIWHSLLLGALAALIVAGFGLTLGFIKRRYDNKRTRLLVQLASLGYAIPGAVLAVGVFLPIAWLDNQIIVLLNIFSIQSTGILKGSLAVMLLALAARFLAVGFSPIDAALQRVTPHQEDSARSLGLNSKSIIGKLYLPMARGGILTGMLLVFVDVIKEMPITLMTRPFGWDTLAIRVFEMTSEGMWSQAALPSLLIIIAGLLPVIILARKSEHL